MKTLAKTFVVSGTFSPEILASFFSELDNQVNEFMPSKNSIADKTTAELISASDTVTIFPVGPCNKRNDEHQLDNFAISRVISYSVKNDNE